MLEIINKTNFNLILLTKIRPKFGKVIELSGEMYISEIDNENKNVTVIVHIYDPVSLSYLKSEIHTLLSNKIY